MNPVPSAQVGNIVFSAKRDSDVHQARLAQRDTQATHLFDGASEGLRAELHAHAGRHVIDERSLQRRGNETAIRDFDGQLQRRAAGGGVSPPRVTLTRASGLMAIWMGASTADAAAS